MQNIVWDNTLSVEVDEIDEDHKRLVELYNLLSKAVSDNDTYEYIDALLEELISCTAWHFRHEERLMIKYQYERFEEHKLEHGELIGIARQLQQKFQQNHPRLSTEDIDYLSDWLTVHILNQDMRMGYYLMKVMD